MLISLQKYCFCFQDIAFYFTICTFLVCSQVSKCQGNSQEWETTRHLYFPSDLRCSLDTYNKTCCNINEFQCNDGNCIPADMVCNSPVDKIKTLSSSDNHLFSQCPDGSDEYGCSYRPCMLRSSKCFGSCTDLAGNRSRCSCDKGYILETSSFDQKCMDIDECQLGFDWCSQSCINLKGSFVCKCKNGFEKDPEGYPGTCKAKDRKVLILYNSYPWIYGFELDSFSPSQEMVPSGHMDGIDFDPTSQIIYWTKYYRLMRSYLPGAKGKTVTMGHSQVIPIPKRIRRFYKKGPAFSIDWAGKNIYWLALNGRARENRAIIVTKLDGRYRKTLMNGVWHATNLIVNPEKGILYWTWLRTREDSGISTAWMNGRYRKTLLRLPGQDPVSLTLDHQADGRIYWVDAITHSIYYAVHHTSIIQSQLTKVSRPFKVITINGACKPQSLSIFENNLYWLNRNCDKLFRRDKFGRGETEIVKVGLSNSSFIKIYHSNLSNEKKMIKAKLNGLESCSHLTLIHPKGFDCECPDEFEDQLQGGAICGPTLKPLEEPLRCDCTSRNTVCEPETPYSACYCFDDCVNYTLTKSKIQFPSHCKFSFPNYRIIISILPLLLSLILVGFFIFITYPLNSGIPLDLD